MYQDNDAGSVVNEFLQPFWGYQVLVGFLRELYGGPAQNDRFLCNMSFFGHVGPVWVTVTFFATYQAPCRCKDDPVIPLFSVDLAR